MNTDGALSNSVVIYRCLFTPPVDFYYCTFISHKKSMCVSVYRSALSFCRAWVSARLDCGGTDTDSWISMSESWSAWILRLASLDVGRPLEDSRVLVRRSRPSVSSCRRVFMLKKQDGHAGHSGKLAQWPRAQTLQRAPVIPGLQRHAPVRLSQPPDMVPERSQSHADTQTKNFSVTLY